MDGSPKARIGAVGREVGWPEACGDQQSSQRRGGACPLATGRGELGRIAELAVRAAQDQIATGGPTRERNHVVGVGAHQRLLGIAARRAEVAMPVAVEQEHARREDAGLGEALRQPARYGAEILADHQGAGACALEREDPQQVVERKAHIGALRSRATGRDPELTGESHDVIDAERAGVTEGRAQ